MPGSLNQDNRMGAGRLTHLCAALLAASFFCACQAKPVLVKPVLEEDGELLVYLQPVPQEAERLTFSLESVSAEKEGGGSYPVALSLADIGGGAVKRQRFLASGVLPPGEYTGLSFKVRSASLRGEEGPTALLVPEEPVTIGFAFRVQKRKSSLLALELDYKKAIADGYHFLPAFSVFVPDRPPIGLLGYAANFGSNNVTVFDKRARQAVGVIATGRGPRGIALDGRSRRAYVALEEDDAVDVIDAEAGDVTNRLRLHPGDGPREPVLSADGSLLLTANSGSDTVSVVDTASLLEVDRIPVGRGPHSVLVDGSGKRAYVFNTRSSTVSVIDIASRALVTTIDTVAEPLRGQFNRNGDRLFVIHGNSPYLTVIDPSSLSVRTRAYVGAGMSAIKVDTRTDLLYVGREPDTLEVLDPVALFPVDSLPVGGRVSSMTIDGDENALYLVLPDRKLLSVLNLVSRESAAAIDVGEGVDWVTMMGER